MAHKPQDKTVKVVQPDQAQLQEEIQKLAYEIYCQCGYEHGHDVAHWVKAEQEVLSRHRDKAATTPS